jgi:hypothetical protein
MLVRHTGKRSQTPAAIEVTTTQSGSTVNQDSGRSAPPDADTHSARDRSRRRSDESILF